MVVSLVMWRVDPERSGWKKIRPPAGTMRLAAVERFHGSPFNRTVEPSSHAADLAPAVTCL